MEEDTETVVMIAEMIVGLAILGIGRPVLTSITDLAIVHPGVAVHVVVEGGAGAIAVITAEA